jgi:hypothetical protein
MTNAIRIRTTTSLTSSRGGKRETSSRTPIAARKRFSWKQRPKATQPVRTPVTAVLQRTMASSIRRRSGREVMPERSAHQ